MRKGLPIVVIMLVTAAAIASCGLGIVGTPNAAPGTEAGADASDASSDDVDSSEFPITPQSDAAYDAPVATVDAGDDGGCPDGFLICPGGTCVSNCLGCATAKLDCIDKPAGPGPGGPTPPEPAKCVADCKACPGSAFTCIACAAGDTIVTRSTCAKDDKGCYVPPTAHCYCKDQGCPGANQLCHHKGNDYDCVGCGEPETDNQTCANASKCHAMTKSCP